jgi:Alpha-2,8-polysialyltransferase (POLYST)
METGHGMNRAAGLGSHVFVVRSSLQFLLASALAAVARPQPSRMLFVPDMADPQLFARAKQDWIGSPFERIVWIDPQQRSSAVRAELRAGILAAQPLSMTVFNDRDEIGQVALIAAAQRFAQAERRCVEDGALAYTGFTYRAHGSTTRLRQTLRVGRGWHDVRVLGTHPLVQRFIALHPPLLRAELRHRDVQPFPDHALASPALRTLAAALCSQSGFDPAAVHAGATVLTLSHSSYAQRNPDYRGLVETLAAHFAAAPGRLFVKYHPREADADYLGLCAQGRAHEIARSLPVESLYLMLRDRPLNVVGGMSTTLLTAGLLMPRVRCAALMHASTAGDAWDATLLQQLRITPLADAAAIDRFFDA